MKYLILGSEGQIGKPLCSYLRNLGHKIIGLDIVNDPNQDLRSYYYMFDHYFSWADFVMFLAFDVGGSLYLKKYEHTKDFLDNNIKIMSTVFDLLQRWKKPFIFASSQMAQMTHSPYGTLKRLGEFYTEVLNGINVQFWNVYGVESDPAKTHVITDFLNAAKNNSHINILTSGLEERQFLHVDDACKALEILSKEYENLDKTKKFAITSFHWYDILKVAEIIANLFPGTQITKSSKEDLVQQGQKNIPDTSILSYWQPTIDLYEGIEKVAKEMKLI